MAFIDFKDASKNYFEGRRFYSPSNQDIELAIDGNLPGPTEAQKQFFQRTEYDYKILIENAIPLITDEFQNWRSDFQIQNFEQEFWPVHMTIPLIGHREVIWELAFRTTHDQNHTVTITYKDFEASEILIDG
ncbi:MAG: hypothetical protein RIG62_27120 [Cyclobacteriaceae bacterium]